MILNTLIVDDEAPSRRRMKKLLGQVSDCYLIGEAESGAEAIEKISSHLPDLIFLDIQLKDMTGFDVLAALPEVKANIIFITAYDAFAINAFELNAVDYLLKPYKESRFFEAISRVKMRLAESTIKDWQAFARQLFTHKPDDKVRISEGKTTHLIDVDRLIYVQADAYYCHLHFQDNKTKIIRISLKKLAEALPKQFLRVNRSYIINKNKIESIKKRRRSTEIELQNGLQLSFDKVIDL
ncbi:MAG: response regulator transcription factor [Cyanothece sp. SIO1E1]|nr:response regulator transcription factor [Cyanothece sp. SIO1E1]